MELVEGPTLGELIAPRGLSRSRARSLRSRGAAVCNHLLTIFVIFAIERSTFSNCRASLS